MKSKKLAPVLRDIEYYFQFLLDRGYKIHNVKELPMGDWQVTLALENCAIVFYSDQGDIGVLFSPIDSNLNYRVGLDSMIYFLSDEKIFLGKFKKSFFDSRNKIFERLSGLLNEYIDQITPYFEKDYEKYKHELMLIQQKYLDVYLDKYIPRRKLNDWK